jgi:DNA repair protein RecN (Recombination protein N)
VTHLAQVGAAAATQISVAKSVVDGRTFASATPIVGEDRVAEVARMLSGSTSRSALDHARELLDA